MRKALIMWVLLFSGSVMLAQGETDPQRLAPYSSLVGNLAPGGVDSWRFDAVNGEVVSLLVESTSQLDPVITVLSETGAVLVTDDDYDYPHSRDAIIQSLTIPFTGTFTAQVRAFGTTGGGYSITRLRGYGAGANLNGFIDGEMWEATDEALAVTLEDQQLRLSLSGIGENAWVTNQNGERLTDYYAHINVDVQLARGGWVVHLNHRQQSDERYYQLSVNDRGLWRYVLRQGADITVLRDWTTHPAIVPGDTQFDLGVMTNGPGTDIFYEGSLLWRGVDRTLASGVLGLGVGTAEVLDAEVGVVFDNLLVTVPVRTTTGGDLLPQQLVLSNASQMATDLERRRIIPAGGVLRLNVPESSTQSLDEGVSRLALGRGATFENFALSAEVTISANQNGVNGCGLFFRGRDDTGYVLAFIDQTGAYGLAQRDDNQFLPGVFGERPQLGASEHHLLVTVVDERIRYYIDGQYVGEIRALAEAGTVGNAVVNYDPNTTTCNFENNWLWTWDEAPSQP